MQFPRCMRLAGALSVALLLVPLTARAQNEKGKSVVIETVDGVKLKGTLYASPRGKDAPTVLMLHNFEKGKGGSSQVDGWQEFAAKLHGKGYSVLTFDFRGHGESTAIDPMQFWSNAFPFNMAIPGRNKNPQPETISQTNFGTGYYPILVNDIAAAKAYLDRQNDSGTLNTSNLIVLGAGEGATLGILWMETEWKRKKAIVPPGALVAPQYPFCKLDEPEGKDQVCGIWLTPSTTLAGRPVPLNTWLRDLGRTHKVPQVFIYGKEDTRAAASSLQHLQQIIPTYQRGKKVMEKGFEFTGEYAVPGTKLAADKLLQKNLDTDTWIIDTYLRPVVEKRGNVEPKDRLFDKSIYYWEINPMARQATLASDARISSKAPKPIPLSAFGLQ
jgi:pimeloyl-ACP methyl ester carboxylesterase